MAYVEPDPPRFGSFESRFERDDDGWLYRYKMRAPAVRVTAEERKALIDANARMRDRALMIILVGGVAAVLLPLLIWNRKDLPWGLWGAGAVVVLAILAADQWRSGVPKNAFPDRPPVEPGRSRREVARLRLERTSWGHLAVWSFLPLFWIGLYGRDFPKQPRAILVVVVWGLFFIVNAITAVRKLSLRWNPAD